MICQNALIGGRNHTWVWSPHPSVRCAVLRPEVVRREETPEVPEDQLRQRTLIQDRDSVLGPVVPLSGKALNDGKLRMHLCRRCYVTPASL